MGFALGGIASGIGSLFGGIGGGLGGKGSGLGSGMSMASELSKAPLDPKSLFGANTSAPLSGTANIATGSPVGGSTPTAPPISPSGPSMTNNLPSMDAQLGAAKTAGLDLYNEKGLPLFKGIDGGSIGNIRPHTGVFDAAGKPWTGMPQAPGPKLNQGTMMETQMPSTPVAVPISSPQDMMGPSPGAGVSTGLPGFEIPGAAPEIPGFGQVMPSESLFKAPENPVATPVPPPTSARGTTLPFEAGATPAPVNAIPGAVAPPASPYTPTSVDPIPGLAPKPGDVSPSNVNPIGQFGPFGKPAPLGQMSIPNGQMSPTLEGLMPPANPNLGSLTSPATSSGQLGTVAMPIPQTPAGPAPISGFGQPLPVQTGPNLGQGLFGGPMSSSAPGQGTFGSPLPQGTGNIGSTLKTGQGLFGNQAPLGQMDIPTGQMSPTLEGLSADKPLFSPGNPSNIEAQPFGHFGGQQPAPPAAPSAPLPPEADISKPIPVNPTQQQPITAETAPSQNAPQMTTNNPYLNELYQNALEMYPDNPVQAQIAFSQAVLESGISPSKLARDNKNLFGIKGQGTAGSVTMRTREVYGGKSVYENAGFAKNNSYKDSFAQHDKLLSKPRYKDVKNASTFEDAAHALYKAGYATDPHYAAKLIAIRNRFFGGGV